MYALALVLVAVASALLGYHYRELHNAVELLKTGVEKRKQPEDKPKAVLLDPDDIVQQAKWEHEQTIKKLNGE